MGEIHFARDNHAEFIFGDLLDTLRRFLLGDFDAQAFIFEFELLSSFLSGDEGITATCTNSAANDDRHSENRKDD